MSIRGKVALVTGASSGIGAATARKLATEGVVVGLAARRKERLDALAAEITGAGRKAVALPADVTDPASCKAAADALITQFGRIDVLINNAGLMPLSSVDSLRVDEWKRMVDVNISGVLNATAAVLPQMIAQHSGHIFNMSSIAGRKVFAGLAVYCATKAAVTAFSDGLRMEIGPKHNIRVTCIQPGTVKSELYEQITDASYRKQMDDLAASMTYLDGEDIADTILFALKAPSRMDVAELFVLPTEQGW
ncbi:SDR family oxidoreductase [Acetobacter pasteurianus]|uniref:SDR family oxidoreductase n=1 Tax=Acetobacter pasteurianus TaxID=438 RepID=UPI0003843EB5|nr:SDR family oxidoreductase [Acetobacter pasteurianus]CCT58365.1 short-chain dehydrogenase/reductase SDR [Acetobacter pasteurianus 386B]CCT60789.1 short-chain dehydrogenase/reductase SDR [Acetobacter pasteurianus 386B]